VFNLNFWHIPAHPVFSKDMVQKEHGISSTCLYECLQAPDEDSGYKRGQGGVSNFTQWLRCILEDGRAYQRHRARLLPYHQNRSLLTQPTVHSPRAQYDHHPHPARALRKPEDLLGTLLWLLSDEGSGFVTGQVIAVTRALAPSAASEPRLIVSPGWGIVHTAQRRTMATYFARAGPATTSAPLRSARRWPRH